MVVVDKRALTSGTRAIPRRPYGCQQPRHHEFGEGISEAMVVLNQRVSENYSTMIIQDIRGASS
jgi:hypothetical protein